MITVIALALAVGYPFGVRAVATQNQKAKKEKKSKAFNKIKEIDFVFDSCTTFFIALRTKFLTTCFVARLSFFVELISSLIK